MRIKKMYAKHRGFILPTALVVALIGGTIAAILLHMGNSILHHSNRQKSLYGDHVSVTDHIQAVKGSLVAYNNNNSDGDDGQRVILHSRDDEDEPINSISDLMLSDYCYDVNVSRWGMGNQKIRVNVYDIFYFYDKLSDSLRANLAADATLASDFPPPINTQAGASTSTSMDAESEVTTGDIPPGPTEGPPIPPWENFGAYLIRAELYEASTGHVVRRAEKAFFQVLSLDIAP